MTGLGVLLIILGVGSLLLPMLNMQFRLMEFVDPYQPWAGLIVGVIGAVLVGMGMQRSRTTVTTTRSTAAAAPAAPAPEAAAAPPAAPPAEASTSPATAPAASSDAPSDDRPA